MPIARDPHAGPVPEAAWNADRTARETKGRVEIFNATRPGGLDGWTMDVAQYEAVRSLILEPLEDAADEASQDSTEDGTVLLKDVVAAAQDRYGNHELFPKGRLTNYVRFTKTDMEARCEVERLPGSGPQRIRLWRDAD
ncbi:MAG: hypothetical protein AAF531_12350 [Actinomycetota bacterium]